LEQEPRKPELSQTKVPARGKPPRTDYKGVDGIRKDSQKEQRKGEEGSRNKLVRHGP